MFVPYVGTLHVYISSCTYIVINRLGMVFLSLVLHTHECIGGKGYKLRS